MHANPSQKYSQEKEDFLYNLAWQKVIHKIKNQPNKIRAIERGGHPHFWRKHHIQRKNIPGLQ